VRRHIPIIRHAVPRLVGLALLFPLAACSGNATPRSTAPSFAPSSPTATASPTATSGAVPFSSVRIGLQRIATLDQPIAMAVRRGDPTLYVAEKTGQVVAIRPGSFDSIVLNLSGRVSQGGEQGLLGIAFSPDGRYLYADFTDTAGNTHVTQWVFFGGRADPSSERTILFVRQPYANHNGGQIAFGPDGDLYVGLGDGGSEGDPQGNGQNLDTLLGKILRVRPTPKGPRPYVVPADNPFVGRAGALPEIWAYGLRNPWRFSFDLKTGDLWIGDVGQNTWEEVDMQPARSHGGQNYGWNLTEGDHPYNGATPPANWTRPVFEYSHAHGGCAIIGGYVYRGRAIPGLDGVYLFSDNCLGGIAALHVVHDKVVGERGLGQHVDSPSAFGQDGSGNLYVLSLAGGVYRVTS
jgi:glucose/arabinose dehydrogenase